MHCHLEIENPIIGIDQLRPTPHACRQEITWLILLGMAADSLES